MEKLEYKGQIIEAENKEELTVKLRKLRLTYREIGELIGRSHAWVGLVLKKKGYSGDLEYPELDDPKTFNGKNDELIASQLGVSVLRVAGARRKLFLDKKRIPNLLKRRVGLVKSLYGPNYKPGPNLGKFLSNLDFLTERQTEIMINFYIKGSEDSPSSKINTDSNRTWRSIIRDKIRKKTKNDIDKLIKEEVISAR